MANFTSPQIEQIEMVLGYSNPISSTIHTQLSTTYTQVVYDRALAILTDLDDINIKLKEATDTSYVTESRGSKLSYSQHVRHLKSEATRLLKELAHILSVELAFNRYSPCQPKSYW
jgi:hypothetical protein